jgi:hypothetical protein
MSSALTNLKDTVERYRARAIKVREAAKGITHEVVGTALAAAVSGGIGAWDEAKGVAKVNDEGYSQAYVGPLPVALIVAAVGKAGAVVMMGDETGRLAGAVGQGGLDAYSYVTGRRLWKRHQSGK